MSRRFIKATSFLLSLMLTTSVFAGCGDQTKEAASTSTAVSTTSQASQTSTTAEVTYPLSTDVTLTYWSPLEWLVSPNYKTLGDTPFAKALEEKTGVKVEYLHPAAGQETDSFSIMVASGDMPDIVQTQWIDFSGGPDMAIENGIISDLTDSFQKYSPNITKYLKENPNVDKMVKSDKGAYYGYPFIRGDEALMVFQGLVVRNDWLKELNLETPTTIDDWHTVLTAFKAKKNVDAPLSWIGSVAWNEIFINGPFIGAYGIGRNFYQEDGKVKFGPYEAGYKDFLATMAQWYKEGLIDKNFSSNDSKAFDASFLAGEVGATLMNVGGGLGKYIPAFKDTDPKADLQPVPNPTLKKGETPKFGQRDLPYVPAYCAAISGDCKNLEIAARWLDYGYSEEGNKLNNFGVEGVSYNMVNGYPTMTDEVLKNPKGLAIGQAWASYARGVNGGPFVQRKEYTEQYNTLPVQQEAISLWAKTDAAKYTMPAVSATADESSRYATIYNDVNTYIQEYNLKVIMGVESIDNFDKHIEKLKKLGIEEAIQIKQAALDRYNKR